MSYTLDNSNFSSPLINVKLTDYARQRLAQGNLNFSYFLLGDTEIDYRFGNEVYRLGEQDFKQNRILSPKDLNPLVTSFSWLSPGLSGGTSLTENTALFQAVKLNVRNVARERGFFNRASDGTVTINTQKTHIKESGIQIRLNSLNGSNVATLRSSGGTALYEPISGDIMMVLYRTPYSQTNLAEAEIDRNFPTPVMFYRVTSKGAGNYASGLPVTVDRPLPNMSSTTNTTAEARVYIIPGKGSIDNYYGTGDTTSYWDSDLLSFNNNCIKAVDDIPVWNMNIVHMDNMPGIVPSVTEEYYHYGSQRYSGAWNKFFRLAVGNNNTLYQFGTNIPTGPRSFALFHYTNNSVSNWYGEFLFGAPIFKLHLPTIMYDKSTGGAMGLTISANETTPLVSSEGNRYYNLIDGFGNQIGRLFPDEKIAAITDQELVAAMTYKSNRSYTLPSSTSVAIPGGTLLNGTIGECIYVTYMLHNSRAYVSGSTLGLNTGLPCMKYSYLDTTNLAGQTLDVQVRLPNNFPFYRDASSFISTRGSGFAADRLLVIAQKGPIGFKPSPDNWKVIDVTTKLINFNLWSSTTIPGFALTGSTQLPNMVITDADYSSAPLFRLNNYNFNIPTPNNVNELGFGDEEYFVGNVETEIGAQIYRTSFLCQAPENRFNSSSNPSYPGQGKPVFVTEVAILDQDQRIVAIGKPNRPLTKNANQQLLVELAIDF